MVNLTYFRSFSEAKVKEKKAVLFFGLVMYISLSMDKNHANYYFNQPARKIPCKIYSLKGQQKHMKLNEQREANTQKYGLHKQH